jgi:hypothetical protein
MRPNFARMLEGILFPDDPPKSALSERDALMKAKVRQDACYDRLDKWLAVTITELSNKKAFAGGSVQSSRAAEHEQTFTVPVPKNEWPGNRSTIDTVRAMSR